LLGYENDELLANDLQSITHPDDLQRHAECIRKLLANDIETYQLDQRYYHRSGRLIWGLLSVSLAIITLTQHDF
jgi:PAS domain S-box-containing protein